ncbi:MAG: hypothetical protein FWF15_01585 [Oscillospiraceae bacterium]|nr:hypothetical protein [Oscillospiraceae bacterium]
MKMKRIMPVFAAVKCKIPLMCLVLALTLTFTVFLQLVSVTASNRQSVQESLDKTSGALAAAEPIYQRLREIIAEEIIAMDLEDETDTDIAGSEAGYEELNGYSKQLDGLISGLNDLSDDPNTSDGKTVRAAREYLSMLRNMTADLSELVRYAIDVYYAIEPMGMMDEDTDEFEVLAEAIWTGCETTRIMMTELKPPSYLTITHNDMIARITEFRDFGEDFYIACYMDDPLRMYSCVYRMNRIIRMFNICDENLTADMELQFIQAERRINGPIAQLHGELTKNLELLKNAQGRG